MLVVMQQGPLRSRFSGDRPHGGRGLRRASLYRRDAHGAGRRGGKVDVDLEVFEAMEA